MRTLLRCVAALKGEKAIVFTQFRATQEAIVEALRADGIDALRCSTARWAGTRRRSRSSASAQRDQVLVSTEAGGEGRNLQFARIVINYDLPWNPMRVEQRIGRVHRLGQEHPVRVVNLVARGTIEAYVLEILERKIRMFELVVGEMEEILGAWQHARLVRGRGVPALDRVARVRACARSASASWPSTWSPRRKLYQQQRDNQSLAVPRRRQEHDEEHGS